MMPVPVYEQSAKYYNMFNSFLIKACYDLDSNIITSPPVLMTFY